MATAEAGRDYRPSNAYKMISIPEAQDIVLQHTRPLGKVQVGLAGALGEQGRDTCGWRPTVWQGLSTATPQAQLYRDRSHTPVLHYVLISSSVYTCS